MIKNDPDKAVADAAKEMTELKAKIDIARKGELAARQAIQLLIIAGHVSEERARQALALTEPV